MTALLLAPSTAFACRYNVRDVGFVDLETEPYRLDLFFWPETPAEMVSLLREVPADILRDCNVEFELLDVTRSPDHPAIQHLPREPERSTPGAVLVSPNGQALPLALAQPGGSFRESLRSILTQIATSPTREDLLTAASQTFAAVLLIQGERIDANARARAAIERALDTIGAQMQSLPKPIAAPPALVVLETDAFARERLLLWSLGLETTPTAQPRALVVYGRARWIGPVMNGHEISELNLTRLLSIIGADCECGLDLAWTLGTRLPVRWDETQHAQTAKALGFDPDSPLVRLEVGRIAGRTGTLIAPSLGYQEVVLATDPIPGARSQPASDAATQTLGTGVPTEPSPPPEAASANTPVLSRALLFLSGLAFSVLAVGLLLLWRARRV